MSTVAIISEYNPFHNGHLYMLNEAKKLTGATHYIALMSGNFMQRGTPSMFDKYTRARMCLLEGIDLVLELPYVYATGSAKDFADGSIHILNKLNTVDYLAFGAETDDVNFFNTISDIIINEPIEYVTSLKSYLSSGLSFPAARTKAIFDYIDNEAYIEELSKPNNILALQYVTALRLTNSSIKPIIIKRQIAMYHDENLNSSISSATAIRKSITDSFDALNASFDHLNTSFDHLNTSFDSSGNTFDFSKVKESLSNDLSPAVIDVMNKVLGVTSPICDDDLTPFLQSSLLSLDPSSKYCDVDESILNRLTKLTWATTYNECIDYLQTKNYTKTRISRALLHIIFRYTNEDRLSFISNDYAFYANILGFRKSSSSLIDNINKNGSIPLITKKANFESLLPTYDIDASLALRMWNLDIFATKLYNCLIFNKFGVKAPSDYTVSLPII